MPNLDIRNFIQQDYFSNLTRAILMILLQKGQITHSLVDNRNTESEFVLGIILSQSILNKVTSQTNYTSYVRDKVTVSSVLINYSAGIFEATLTNRYISYFIDNRLYNSNINSTYRFIIQWKQIISGNSLNACYLDMNNADEAHKYKLVYDVMTIIVGFSTDKTMMVKIRGIVIYILHLLVMHLFISYHIKTRFKVNEI